MKKAPDLDHMTHMEAAHDTSGRRVPFSCWTLCGMRILWGLKARSLASGLLLTALLALWAPEPSAQAEKPLFKTWLKGVRKEALSMGISANTLDQALPGLKPLTVVIRLDRAQPEFRLTLDEYLGRMITEKSVQQGRERLHEHRNLLKGISDKYGVQPEYVMALWGIETRYGQRTGGYPVLAALATLAYDGRRSNYFRKELLRALKILDEGHISVDRMNGSWAGAMGQVQFMPSSFHAYAVDHDRDGRIDIWNNVADALASGANYLARSGWKKGQGWGREVRLPDGFDRGLIGPRATKTVGEWERMGVSGRGLNNDSRVRAWVVQPDGKGGRAFLAYPNYSVILKWNRSNFFAVAVGTLADRLRISHGE